LFSLKAPSACSNTLSLHFDLDLFLDLFPMNILALTLGLMMGALLGALGMLLARIGREQRLRTELAEAQTALRLQRESADERARAVDELRRSFQTTFAALSSEALKSNNSAFLELARQTLARYQEQSKGELEKRQQAIGELVQPLKQALEKVDTRITEIEKARTGAYEGIRTQVQSLIETQQNLRSETANLVQALRRPEVRGRWGEMQLERTVHLAGMLEHVDFVQQETTRTEDGALRPDMLVRLPNGNTIVVDAKVPLDAFLSALEARDDAERSAQRQRHARQIRDHIKRLGRKEYWRQFEPSPEFVVLFIPGEAFFSAALEEDPELIQTGTAENVLIATPTTLIALLKAVAYGWRQEQIAAQAKEISELGRELYDRIAVQAGHIADLGKALGKSVEAYNKSVRSLDTRVLVTARKFESLAPAKSIPDLPPVESTPVAPKAAEPTQPPTEE